MVVESKDAMFDVDAIKAFTNPLPLSTKLEARKNVRKDDENDGMMTDRNGRYLLLLFSDLLTQRA